MELDVSQLRETLSAGKQQIAMILQEVAIATKQCEVLEIVLKEKELQWSKLKRCHLCLGENLTTKLREKSLQQGGGSGTGRSTSELGDASLDAASLKSSTTTVAKEKGTRSVMKISQESIKLPFEEHEVGTLKHVLLLMINPKPMALILELVLLWLVYYAQGTRMRELVE
jgi:hypothetical protein